MQRSIDDVLGDHPLLPVAWAAGTAAGSFLLDQRPEDLAIESKSTPVDAVTEMDRGSEDIIVESIIGARPEDGLLGEEGGERHGTSGVRWVVDPLDATVNYLYRIPFWAVSIAAETSAGTEVGVVVAPALGESYLAARGHGAWRVREGVARPMHVGQCAGLSMALVGTGFGYQPSRRAEQARVVQGLITQVRDIRRIGCAALDLALLADGHLDGFYELGLNRWDIAAGALIAQEAGARVGSLESADIYGSTFVGAIPGIYEPLQAALAAVS